MHYQDCSLLLGFGPSSIPLSNVLMLSLSDLSYVSLISKSRTMLPLFLHVNISYIIIVFFLGVKRRSYHLFPTLWSTPHPSTTSSTAPTSCCFPSGSCRHLREPSSSTLHLGRCHHLCQEFIRSLCHSFLSTSLQERGASTQTGAPHVGVP